jgi:hypothetical protein
VHHECRLLQRLVLREQQHGRMHGRRCEVHLPAADSEVTEFAAELAPLGHVLGGARAARVDCEKRRFPIGI